MPGQGAAEHLRRALEAARPLDGTAVVIPDLVTRDEWLERLFQTLPGWPAAPSPLEREVLLQAAARDAIAAGRMPPFRLRARIVEEMLAFYDSLRRQLRTVADFERLVTSDLERAVDSDRGARRLLAQTEFLVAAFSGYESRALEGRLTDEHALRDRLLEGRTESAYRHVIVTVGDRINDPAGLWPCDFDLLARIPGLDRIDIVATAPAIDAGFGLRVQQALPGIELVRGEEEASDLCRPVLSVPLGIGTARHHVYRDREAELGEVARNVKHAARSGTGAGLPRTAIVFKRPLPYVYLAHQLLPSAGIPYQTFDALPLAAEPYAAALNQIFECVDSGFSRSSLVALLRAPMFRFDVEGHRLEGSVLMALDHELAERRYLGGVSELTRLAEELTTGSPRGGVDAGGSLADAAEAAASAARELQALATPDRPSAHLGVIRSFLDAHDHLRRHDPGLRERHLRARKAIRDALAQLRAACLAHDDTPGPFADLASTVRRWIEDQTFSPRTGSSGLHLLDAQTARFGEFDAVYLVGLIEREWAQGQKRSIFYPPWLLKDLGWPQDADTAPATRAAFLELLDLPQQTVSVSAFTLEDDSLVDASVLVEELGQSGQIPVAALAHHAGRVFASEALKRDPLRPDVLGGDARGWFDLRRARGPFDEARFHGQAMPLVANAYKVSALERYRECPFKYFASEVLELGEEPEDEDAMSPRLRGVFVHGVLQQFFERWQSAGHANITLDSLDAARSMFAEVVEEVLSRLNEAEVAIERERLLGSPLAPGIGEIIFRAELGRLAPVVERKFEYSLDCNAAFRTGSTERIIAVRAKADRIDLLEDGTFRVVDYKLSRAPRIKDAVQLPAYAAAARTRLAGHGGRDWQPSEAAYVAFGKDRNYVTLEADSAKFDDTLREGEARVVETVEGIERGAFPPSPADKHLCTYCPFSGVCRKEYVGGE